MRIIVAIAVTTLILGAGIVWAASAVTGSGVPGHVREDARLQAEYFCTMGGVAPGMESTYDDAYLSCVDDWTQSYIDEWERTGSF